MTPDRRSSTLALSHPAAWPFAFSRCARVQSSPVWASRFASWQNGPSGACLTDRRRSGFAATPVSRLFIIGVRRSPIAYSSAPPQGTPAGSFWSARVSRRSEVAPARTALHPHSIPTPTVRRLRTTLGTPAPLLPPEGGSHGVPNPESRNPESRGPESRIPESRIPPPARLRREAASARSRHSPHESLSGRRRTPWHPDLLRSPPHHEPRERGEPMALQILLELQPRRLVTLQHDSREPPGASRRPAPPASPGGRSRRRTSPGC